MSPPPNDPSVLPQLPPLDGGPPTGPGALPVGVPAQVPPQVLERLLFSAPFLAGCAREVLASIVPEVRAIESQAGAVLHLHEGGAPGLVLLISGKARAFAGPENEAGETVEVLQAPDFFGEVGVLTGGVPGYTVIADGATRCLWIPAEIVLRLFESAPKFALTVAQRLAIRFQQLVRSSPAIMLLPEPMAEAAPAPAPAPVPVVIAAEPAEGSGVIRYVEVADYDLQPSVLGLVSPKIVRQHRALPLKLAGRRLTLGLVAPRNQAAVAELRRALQAFELEFVAIGLDDYNQTVVRYKLDEARGGKPEREKIRNDPDSLVFETAEQEAAERGNVPKTVGEDVIRAVARIVAAALDRDASDIHFEPHAGGIRIRFRVNGTLQDWTETVPAQLARGVVARVKVIAGLDITERRRPQDGRISVKAGKRDFDLRVSSLPSSRGEKIVMRVLDGTMGTRPLGQLFVEPRVLGLARKALNRPYGGIIIAGATGAGKTSSLYSMLNERRTTRPDTHIVMVEDPIEYRLDGVTQVQVDHGANLGFAQVLRSMLRQDPDVIVVGEMRDAETARIGLEAAMTGHVLLTSLHANAAFSALQRLEQLGCGRPLISQALSLILVQRLVRRLCSACRTTVETPQALVDNLIARHVLEPGASRQLPQPVGCDACHKTGYVGRVAVMEALHMSDEVRHHVAAGANLQEVEATALEHGALVPFASYAAALLKEGMITGTEALLTVAE